MNICYFHEEKNKATFSMCIHLKIPVCPINKINFGSSLETTVFELSPILE